MEVDFTCTEFPGSQESVTLVHGVPTGDNPVGDTYLVDDALGELAEDDSESLTINCIPPVGGIAELPDVAAAPVEAGGSSGPGVALVAAIAGAVVIALSGAAWYARRWWSS